MLTIYNSQICNDLPASFNSYQEANTLIKSTNFTIEDSVDTSKSSFINEASYYSCDKQYGFLIIKIRSTEYIFKDVPINIWEEFKNADSFGKFFNYNLKGNYHQMIEND